MKITYYGHSCFLLEAGGKRLLLDPFVRGNPLAAHLDVNSIACDYIFLSHAHQDHIGDVEIVHKNNPDAMVVAMYEVSSHFAKKGVKTHGMGKGGWWTFDFGRVKMVHAVHSSSFADGTYGGEPAGFVFDTRDGVIYFAGDTALTLDMQLIPMLCPPLDFAILPIGGNFTMTFHDAVIASDFVRCNHVVGCHFDSFPPIVINRDEAVATFAEKQKILTLLGIGETKEISG